MLRDAIKGFYGSLLAGDGGVLSSIFVNEPLLNTPLQGEVRGAEAFDTFVDVQKAWLEQRAANPEVLASILTDERIVVELVLYLQQNGDTIDLPVALVADLAERGVTALRVYHSTWPLMGKHMIRKLPPQAGLAIYELAGPDKIQAARIYDDVAPPFE